MIHTINVPINKGTIEVEGKACYLYVGQYRHKFLLQQTKWNEVFLTHWDSGQKLGSLTPIKLRFMQTYKTMKDRAAAEQLITDLVNKHGADTVHNKLQSAKQIN